MSIRSTVKAILCKENQILLNRCQMENGEIYYDLPGGGQNPYESLEEALHREILEETGYQGRILRLAALAEEIYDEEELRESYPEYAHRIFHIFVMELCGKEPKQPGEKDWQQLVSVWIPLVEADRLNLRPRHLIGRVTELVQNEFPIYLGTIHVK
ncbi:MAG TPA: NUDIX domain-containing protein [Candidatus Faecimorpha stercoravium]|nr:NUDIX domain-containing protein [Candidatus Faecimorpha stercoravium]